jgi:NADH dehydrogenase FAD-containing subunit
MMAQIVVFGAGLGGMPMACEMRVLARRNDEVTVVFAQSEGGA